MEDLKEIGYEGGKTTHGDVRQAINANVSAANRNFSEVSAAATEAQEGVTELGQQLEGVSSVASAAQEGVTELGQQLEGVSSVASEAKTGVTELGQLLGEVSSVASEAQAGVTELGQQLDEVSAVAQEALETASSAQHTAATAQGAADGLAGDVTAMGLAQSVLTDYAGSGEPVAAGSSAVSVLTSALKADEIVPWHGWFTLVACYTTTDGGAQIGVSGRHGDGAEQVIVPMTTIAAGERAVARVTADPGTRTVALEGGDAVELRKLTAAQGFTLHWAVVYESDEYGNQRRRGGSERALIEANTGGNGGYDGYSLTQKCTYNEKTGMFELNGITDLTWTDVRNIVFNSQLSGVYQGSTGDHYPAIRTNTTLRCWANSYASQNIWYPGYGNNNIEVVARYKLSSNRYTPSVIDSGLGFSNCAKLRAVIITIEPSAKTFLDTPNLETCYISAKKSFTIYSNYISYYSIKFAIQNSNNTSPITITVPEAIYSKLSGSTVENWGSLATLASGKNITLLAKGDTGYPFLTEVLWHSYAALQKKINDAANGSTIYIHTQDKEKITSSQQDNWGTLVTLAAEKNITFAQAE